MNNGKKNLLTNNQFTFFLMGFVIGPAFLRLPNVIVPIAQQDAWITAIIALIYPVITILISCIIIKKHPKENILVLSKNYFGNFFGTVLNIVFMLQFILYTAAVTEDFVRLTRTYIVGFIPASKIIVIAVSLAAYNAFKGIKTIGKSCELISYIFIGMLFFSLSALKYGKILNVQPVFGAGVSNILKAFKDTLYFYTGWEAILLFHPYVEDIKSIKKTALKGVAICGVIWVWTVFATIYYLGVDVVPKSYWSFVMVFESIHIPIINNFRYIFMFTWVLVVFRIISIYYFSSAYNLSVLTKINIKKLCIIIYPFILYLSYKISSSNLFRKKLIGFATPTFVIFNLLFISLIAVFIRFKYKKGEKVKELN
ncbi:GerAB/ArcD/ProY family transporter [Oceanirhabdus sp. W0125-5]|uniref:GerAB/ArcD/ProY family transporter n=1 Tax=Oceanirhabdus sp. W0125-5 TaxID=2999116 RepID=UPI0022F2FBA5|nr:GerAB/ArcD/ProY family transporter [Oceanirhabdus sp. W0125-5]WBW98346.1 GerAB/ArcD/ProY family transporter [Oceanirhabdus sp. W0125-5]